MICKWITPQQAILFKTSVVGLSSGIAMTTKVGPQVLQYVANLLAQIHYSM